MPVSTTRSAERATMMAIGKQRPPVHLAFARSAARKHVVLHEPGIGGGQARSATAIYRAWPDRPGCGGMVAVDPPLWGGSAGARSESRAHPSSRGPSGQSQSLRTSKAAWSVNPIRAAITSECSGSRQGGPDRNERARENMSSLDTAPTVASRRPGAQQASGGRISRRLRSRRTTA